MAVEENEATVTWDAVPGAASYRVYVNGTAQYPNVTDTSYVYYMQPCATNTPDYLKKQYTFTVAAVTSAGGEGARITSDPVSYTHLDVYKRQE